MDKKVILIILLVFFVIADIGVINTLVEVFEENEVVSNSDYDSDESYDNKNAGENMENVSVFSTGDVIDLIDSEIVPCVCGASNKIYSRCSLDDYDEYDNISNSNYYQSNYGNNFRHLMTCRTETSAKDVSFSLDKKYSKLSFQIGLWDCENEDISQVVIFNGYGDNKKEIFNTVIEPGDKEQEYTVDVSDCEVLTIRLVSPQKIISYLVTDGFKLTYK